jgi:hypothetical protein
MKEKRMKRNGKRKSILGNRNQVMGYTFYIYLVPYVVYYLFSHESLGICRRDFISINTANAGRNTTGLCV